MRTLIDGVPIRVFAPEDLLLRKIYLMRDDGPSPRRGCPGRSPRTCVELGGADPSGTVEVSVLG